MELEQARGRAISGSSATRFATKATAIGGFTEIATLHIEWKASDRPVWRVVAVPTSITLKVLHDIA